MAEPADWIRALSAALELRFDELERWIELPEPLGSARPAREAWSPQEIVEHVVLMQRFVLLLTDKIAARARRRLAAGARPPAQPSDFSILEELAAPTFRWSHPVHMGPTGGVAREDLLRELTSQRERCLAYLGRMPHGEGALHTIRMSVVGRRLDLYQYLALIELHLARHLAQLERTRAALSCGHPPQTPREPGAPGP